MGHDHRRFLSGPSLPPSCVLNLVFKHITGGVGLPRYDNYYDYAFDVSVINGKMSIMI